MPRRTKNSRRADSNRLLKYPLVTDSLAHPWIGPTVAFVCFLVGIGLLLVWLRVIPVREPSGPLWIAGDFGVLFLFACYRVLRVYVDRLRSRSRLKRNSEDRPEEPWLADHDWDERGTVTRIEYSSPDHILGVVMAVGILAPLNWIAFAASGDFAWMAGATALDAGMLAVIGFQVQTLVRRHRHGRPFLKFEEFPVRPGRTFRCHAHYSRKLGRVRRLTATLRYVEEDWQENSTAEGTTVRVAARELYCDRQELDVSDARALANGGLDLMFSIPHDAESTTLNRLAPRYWDLELIAELSGIDFRHHFLIPVYT